MKWGGDRLDTMRKFRPRSFKCLGTTPGQGKSVDYIANKRRERGYLDLGLEEGGDWVRRTCMDEDTSNIRGREGEWKGKGK